MFLSRSLWCHKAMKISRRFFSDKVKRFEDETPFNKMKRVFSLDMKGLRESFASKTKPETVDSTTGCVSEIPFHVDIVVIGGGIMGSSIAYWIKERAAQGLRVLVVEKDPTYSKCSTVLSVGGLRQQFSLPENILMSQFGAEFFRTIKHHLGEETDVQFTPHGYLILASEETAPQLEENYKLQQKYNVRNELLKPEKLKALYPWLNTEGIALGCRGLENEGWFDPWSLLNGFKKKAIELGAEYVKGEVVGFGFEDMPDVFVEGVEPGTYRKMNSLNIKTDNGEVQEVKFSICVLAAGAASGEVAKLANIGTGKGMLSIALPVEPRKRYVYCFTSQDQNCPGINTPMVLDQTGLYFRREGLGNNFIAGRSPLPQDEPPVDNLDVDHNFFETDVWPYLADRVPGFAGVKVNSGWAGYYEFNTFDENGIIGPHPYYQNLFIATGFSGHGIQQSPAVGVAVMEMILDGNFSNIDLTRLGFDRIITERPMYETNIF